MSPIDIAQKIAKRALGLAAQYPSAIEALGHAVENIITSKDPVEAARRAALVTASENASEEALKRILGRSS